MAKESAKVKNDEDLDEVLPKPEKVKISPSGFEQGADDLVNDEYTESGMRGHFFRPAIICGICEHCGSSEYVGGGVTKSTNKQGELEHHYSGGKWEARDATLCKHYKNLQIKCTYCNEQFTGLKSRLGKFAEILATRLVYVMSFTDSANKVIMYCDSFECKEKHIKRMSNASV